MYTSTAEFIMEERYFDKMIEKNIPHFPIAIGLFSVHEGKTFNLRIFRIEKIFQKENTKHINQSIQF